LVPITNLKPVTASKLPMEDIDISFTYHVNPAAIPTLYTKYSASYNVKENGEIFIMRGMIEQFVRSAVADAISKYPALQVNDSRAEIAGLIAADVQSKIKSEGLDKDLTVGQIVFTNVSIPQSIVQSTQQVVAAQNGAKTAEFEASRARVIAQGVADAQVIKAEGEAKAIAVQASTIAAQGGANYIQLEAVRKWNGALPQYMTAGTPTPFVSIK
jgi:prohibitin 2